MDATALLEQNTDSNKNLPYEMDDDWEFLVPSKYIMLSWYPTHTYESPWASEARAIGLKLLNHKRPPSLDEVSLHPFLWSSKKHIQFYMDATALLEQNTDSNKNLGNEMKNEQWLDFGYYDEWKSGVPLDIYEDFISIYDTKSSLINHLSAPSISDLPIGLLSDIVSFTLPDDEMQKVNWDYFFYYDEWKSGVPLDIYEDFVGIYDTKSSLINHLSAPSISDLPIGLLSDILSLTSPVDACGAAAVSKIFKTVADSDYVWDKFLPLDLYEIIARAVSNVVFHSQKELYFLLLDSYILLDRGTLAFKLDKESGKKCYMLAARDLSIAWYGDKRSWEWGHMPESRFAEVVMLKEVWCLDIHGIITTAMLSPKTMYVAYLVFRTTRWSSGLNVPAKTIVTVGGIRNETSNVYLQRPGTTAQPQVSHTMRKDGWMEILLGEFYCDDGDEGEVEMVFENLVNRKAGLIVQGMEVRPK